MFRKPVKKEWVYLAVVVVLYLTAIAYVYTHKLSFGALFKYGLLQPNGITGEEARLTKIERPPQPEPRRKSSPCSAECAA